MVIDCIVLATAKRQEWLNLSIESLENQKFIFNKKILSVDEFDGEKLKKDFIEKFEFCNWQIDIVSYKSKHLSLKKCVDSLESDYVFYTEDDIVVKDIPKNLIDILNIEKDGRKCGMLSMNLGGSTLDYPKSLGDLPLWSENIIYENDKIISFIRSELHSNGYFLEFPCFFIRTDILKDLLSGNIIDNNLMERELTFRYLTKEYHKNYYKSSLCDVKILDLIPLFLTQKNLSFWVERLESVKLYKILDTHQGGANINLNMIDNV